MNNPSENGTLYPANQGAYGYINPTGLFYEIYLT